MAKKGDSIQREASYHASCDPEAGGDGSPHHFRRTETLNFQILGGFCAPDCSARRNHFSNGLSNGDIQEVWPEGGPGCSFTPLQPPCSLILPPQSLLKPQSEIFKVFKITCEQVVDQEPHLDHHVLHHRHDHSVQLFPGHFTLR